MKVLDSYSTMDTTKDIRLNGNESYMQIDNNIFFKSLSSLRNIEFNRYPDNDGVKLRKAYGEYADINYKNIIMGNGSDEMLALVIGKYISKGKKFLTLSPEFSMYDFYVGMNEGEMVKVKSQEDGSYSIEEFINIGKEENVDLIMISNPNNPTGYAINLNEIERILREFPNKIVLIDEAYFEFNGESAISLINEYNNLLITRTLSKAWGLAAIRVGFLIGNQDLIEVLSRYKVPYNVSSISQEIALKILENKERVIKNTKIIIEAREELYKKLEELQEESSLEIKFYKSKGNFIFGRTPYKEALINAMDNRGISIRSFHDDTFRITIGSPLENEKALECIRKAFVTLGGGGYE